MLTPSLRKHKNFPFNPIISTKILLRIISMQIKHPQYMSSWYWNSPHMCILALAVYPSAITCEIWPCNSIRTVAELIWTHYLSQNPRRKSLVVTHLGPLVAKELVPQIPFNFRPAAHLESLSHANTNGVVPQPAGRVNEQESPHSAEATATVLYCSSLDTNCHIWPRNLMHFCTFMKLLHCCNYCDSLNLNCNIPIHFESPVYLKSSKPLHETKVWIKL
jgi:hypothetical protein